MQNQYEDAKQKTDYYIERLGKKKFEEIHLSTLELYQFIKKLFTIYHENYLVMILI
jgi:hypothetical protein